jgi:hypothetical protein
MKNKLSDYCHLKRLGKGKIVDAERIICVSIPRIITLCEDASYDIELLQGFGENCAKCTYGEIRTIFGNKKIYIILY